MRSWCGPSGSRRGGRPTTPPAGSRTCGWCWRAASAGESSNEPPSGTEHDWGEVTAWEPPHRFVYLWHLRRDRADATEVEIRFVPDGEATRVEIEHRGWERLGAEGREWRDRNMGGWSTLLPHFIRAAEERTASH